MPGVGKADSFAAIINWFDFAHMSNLGMPARSGSVITLWLSINLFCFPTCRPLRQRSGDNGKNSGDNGKNNVASGEPKPTGACNVFPARSTGRSDVQSIESKFLQSIRLQAYSSLTNSKADSALFKAMLRNRREMERMKETTRPSTLAHDYMREEIEKKKKEKKSISSAEKQTYKDQQFSLKQQKKKEKHRGH